MSAVTAAAIGAGGAIVGGVAGAAIQAKGAQSAADRQVQAQQEAIAFQREQAANAERFQREQAAIARQDLEPFRQAQLSALGQAQALSDPNHQLYQQQRSQNTEAIQRQLAAQGLLRSKSQVDLLSNLELGLNQQRFGNINALANIGAAQQQSAIASNLGGQLGGLYSGLGQQVGASIQQAGAAQAQGILGQYGAAAQGVKTIGNAFQGFGSNLLDHYQGKEKLRRQDAFNSQILALAAQRPDYSNPLSAMSAFASYKDY